ncbi:MAG: YheT family hydrolase [Panacagrimonas sp.]
MDGSLVSVTDFRPGFGLGHPGVQATLASMRPAHRIWRRRGLDLNARSQFHTLDCGDDVRLTGMHTAHPAGTARGLVVLIHGWEGCHDSSYLYSMACALFTQGYNIFRLNLRDHAGTHHLNLEMFHSARMAEVLGACAEILKLDATVPLYVIGYSLGGNFALRIALRGPALGIVPRLTVAVSPAIDPGATLRGIDDGPALFRWYFLKRWHKTLEAKRKAWPHYDFQVYRDMKRFTDVTRQFVADQTGYASLDEYLAEYTLTPEMLARAPSPIAVITARDDSVIPEKDFAGLAPHGSVVSFDAPDRGGHCGFIENWRLDCWAEKRVLSLLGAYG